MTSSYVNHLAVSHASDTKLSLEGTPVTPPAASPFGDMSGNAHYATLASQVAGLQVSLARLSLAEALSWLLGLIDEAIDAAIGLAQDLVAAIFDAIKAALADVDKQLGDRIEIPLVTALYEQVITKGRHPQRLQHRRAPRRRPARRHVQADARHAAVLRPREHALPGLAVRRAGQTHSRQAPAASRR